MPYWVQTHRAYQLKLAISTFFLFLVDLKYELKSLHSEQKDGENTVREMAYMLRFIVKLL